MKKSLVLVAHGSRREASNEEVRQVAVRMAERAGGGYQEVTAAFLELASPSIPEGIVAAVDRGASEVIVLPYFLSAGRHVVTDIPEEVAKARAQRPEARIRTTPYLGAAEGLLEVLTGLAEND